MPVLHADLKIDFPHDAIMMDIEGGELDFCATPICRGQRFRREMHREVYGREGMRECRHLLKWLVWLLMMSGARSAMSIAA